MKKKLLSIMVLTALAFGASAQNVNIPDANFKTYLVGNTGINTNGDGEIQVSEATSFNGVIYVSSLGISDLTGIEQFTNITGLFCDFNNLTTLDLSANTNLQNVVCNNNSISSLDLTGCSSITQLIAATNNITSVDFSTNTGLQILNIGINSLTSLDVTSNVNLTHFYCFSNNLSSLNVANGNNTNIAAFLATSNPNLTCIQVDDVAYSNANWSGGIDGTASFSLNCCTIDIPDANFKSYLVGNTAINTNADSEIQCSEASGFTGTINCQNLNISDLTGIEAFTSLTTLLCGNNPLGTIDVSQNTALTVFQPVNNNLSSLDVTQNTALTNLVVQGNNLTSIDLSQNVNLNLFSCGLNTLNALDVSQNVNLTILSCRKNNLTSLNVSNNTALTNLVCDTNNLTSLNLKNLSSATLTTFNAAGNPNLTCIKVDDVADATTNWTNIDPTASFSLSCATIYIDSIFVQGQGGVSTINTFGGTLQMEASIFPTNASDTTYTWSVTSGTGSATIDTNGVLTAVANGTVTVTATANDSLGISGSATITISNQEVSSVNEQVNGDGVHIYPNPVSTQIFIATDKKVHTTTIVDVIGETVETIPTSNNTIDVSDLATGVYFLQIQTEDGLISKKFIKK